MLDGVFGKRNFRNEIVWCYVSPGDTKRFFKRNHDTIFFYTKTDNPTWTNYRIPYKESYIKSHFKGGLYRRMSNGKIYTANQGQTPNDYWDIPIINSMAKQRLGYPTQKPRALYERIIKASSNQGDTVLDPFAGSGTTLDAAESLGRKWIGIDVGDEAIQTIEQRLRERHGFLLDYEVSR